MSGGPGLREALLAAVPDAPETLELRAMLLDGASELAGTPSGAVVISRPGSLAAFWGEPAAEPVAELLAAADAGWSLLAAAPRADLAPRWRWAHATLLTLADRAALAAAVLAAEAAGVGPVGPVGLARADRSLRPELDAALAAGRVVGAREAGRVVAFAYAPWRTERLFDVSVDTAPAARGRGHGRRCAAALIARERAAGREPVWGAADTNGPSLAVARALGFRPAGALWVAEPPPELRRRPARVTARGGGA